VDGRRCSTRSCDRQPLDRPHVEIARSLGSGVPATPTCGGHGSSGARARRSGEPARAQGRHRGVVRHGHLEHQPPFVYGTVGPLLTDPRVSYVKGSTVAAQVRRRPAVGGRRARHRAGRAAADQPVQPAAVGPGAAALRGVRRAARAAGAAAVLHRLWGGDRPPHRIVENFGLNSIAQTDLGVRIPPQPDLDLSKMAFAIMAGGAEAAGRPPPHPPCWEINRSMK